MGVYIEGLRMPKQGRYITVNVYHDGTVKFQFGGELAGKAYEVPEKHGRLIDADALLYETRDCDICEGDKITERIYDAPTIIEAEGK